MNAGLFTRCLVCNVPVEEADAAAVADRVPPYVLQTQERFARCPSCGRIIEYTGDDLSKVDRNIKRAMADLKKTFKDLVLMLRWPFKQQLQFFRV